MDNKFFKILKSTSVYVFAELAVDKTFNGWFLMKTPQVSTRGVSLSSKSLPFKNSLAAAKLQYNYLACRQVMLYADSTSNYYPQNIYLWKVRL